MAAKTDGRPIVPLTPMHKALTTFEGKWKISHKFFTGPDTKPIVAHGHTTCKVLLNGLATYMESELDNGYKAIVMSTWNPTTGRYEGVFLDLHSFDGFDPLIGMPTAHIPVAKNSSHNLSDSSLLKPGHPVRERVWNGRLTTPRMAALAAGAPLQLAGVDEVPAQIVEHQVSDDEWMLLCVAPDETGAQFVMVENTYTRAS